MTSQRTDLGDLMVAEVVTDEGEPTQPTFGGLRVAEVGTDGVILIEPVGWTLDALTLRALEEQLKADFNGKIEDGEYALVKTENFAGMLVLCFSGEKTPRIKTAKNNAATFIKLYEERKDQLEAALPLVAERLQYDQKKVDEEVKLAQQGYAPNDGRPAGY